MTNRAPRQVQPASPDNKIVAYAVVKKDPLLTRPFFQLDDVAIASLAMHH